MSEKKNEMELTPEQLVEMLQSMTPEEKARTVGFIEGVKLGERLSEKNSPAA